MFCQCCLWLRAVTFVPSIFWACFYLWLLILSVLSSFPCRLNCMALWGLGMAAEVVEDLQVLCFPLWARLGIDGRKLDLIVLEEFYPSWALSRSLRRPDYSLGFAAQAKAAAHLAPNQNHPATAQSSSKSYRSLTFLAHRWTHRQPYSHHPFASPAYHYSSWLWFSSFQISSNPDSVVSPELWPISCSGAAPWVHQLDRLFELCNVLDFYFSHILFSGQRSSLASVLLLG